MGAYDDTSGQNMQSYVLPVRLLADMALIPDKTFAALNLSYLPTFAHSGGTWQQQNPFEIALAASTAIFGSGFLGVEIRQSMTAKGPLPLRLRLYRRWTLRRSQAQGFNIPALASPAHFG